MQLPEDKLLLVDYHVVTQIVKAKLIVGNIGDVAGICLASLLGLHVI